MTIVYRDEGGYIAALIDEDGIDFSDGAAYFSVDDEDYKIDVQNIVRIVQED